ncbi:pyrroline-5-carboxylate reductase dimerization domain-containing protein [Exiguobacterium sp. s193]|uniref:pyrroline-5-carboxylate reductase family protein n=1 Tax=Exiguobacterium sp. s193 TaxID=2751207 RepID=UPI001BE67652|nr:pyrroline-5-carboxylate reductase dimerization domain-containing protein [Exiguobacterium sp. s193]
MTILMVGAGSMSESLVKGWIASGIIPQTITMTNRADRGRLSELAERYGVQIIEDENVESFDIVILAMQPDGVLPYVKSQTWTKQIIISVAAHITPDEIENLSGCGAICAMPNTPVAFRTGMTGLWFGQHVSTGQKEEAKALFQRVGEVAETDEATMPFLMAAAGCSPAFFYEIVGAMTPVLAEAGFEAQQARRIIAQAMKGSAELLLQDDRPTEALIDDVAAEGGPTARGVQVLRTHELDKIMRAALSESAREA